MSPGPVCRSDAEKKKIISRLRRIEGQTRGLQKMIEEDRECIDVLRQISSVSGALHGVWVNVLNDHLKGCIREALVDKNDKLVDDLIEHLKKVK
ncbi:MAG: metal-sensitive transcriptional regulator [Kiritimatiellales bacterium]